MLIANYGILIGEGALNTRADFVTMLVAYSVSILIVLIVLIMQGRMRRKTNSELGYLMGLQRRLTGQ